MTVSIAIWSIAAGMVIAIFSVYYNRTILGSFVRTLIESGALSKGEAMTLAEAGYEKSFFIKRALKRGGMFRKIVFEIEDEIMVASEGHSFSARSKPIDLDTARFYVAKENRIMAEMRYDNKGVDVFGIVVSVILIAIFAYLATLFVPTLLEYIKAL
ncbi:MAG: hypothetical protein E7626_05920 [Ruminococcaceae bacterium]|nr:hypothetical protein [Oscillospiraceae bacterium]